MLDELVRKVTTDFCLDFVRYPYQCYTEHGLHALYYTWLYNTLPPENRFINWLGEKVCVLQKEYPTFGSLGKPKRQNWDIALIKNPPQSKLQVDAFSYDYLCLDTVVEFGMNEAENHLQDDMDRLCHPDANVEQKILVHLYRISAPGHQFSHRDWSANSARVVPPDKVARMTSNRALEVFYGIADCTGRYRSEAYRIVDRTLQILSG